MTYSRIIISGTDIVDARDVSVTRALNDSNSASSFNIQFDNPAGRQAGKYGLNDNVKILCGEAPTDGLLGYWRFNEGSGNIAFDMMGNCSGTQVGGVSWASGILGSCVSFDGTNDRLLFFDSGDKFDLGSKDNYSVSVWFKSNAQKEQSITEHWQSGSSSYPWAIRGPRTGAYAGQITFACRDAANSVVKHTSSGAYNDGQWHNVVGVRDYDNDRIVLYVDGNYIGSSPDTTAGDVSATVRGFEVGRRNAWMGDYYSGQIDELRIYDRAVSSDEISKLYNNGVGTDSQCIINGVIENIDYQGEGLYETMSLSGRDYTALLQDITIPPIVYKNKEVSYIIKDIMKIYVPQITYFNVKTTTTTIDRIVFNQLSVFDAFMELAQISEYYFYVDSSKDLHFEKKMDYSTNTTLDNTNTLKASFQTNDRDIYNKVWVYGARVLTGNNQQFVTNGGSDFTLTDKPHNTQVFLNGSIQQPGGVLNISDPATMDIHWVVDFDNRKVIFVSGVQAGNNVPASGGSISINYDRSTPIVKFDQDDVSINAYGPKTKVIKDDTLSTSEQATLKVNTFLAQNKDPIIQGDISFNGVYDFVPGRTVGINFPNQDVSGIYQIFSTDYSINSETLSTGRIMNARINKKVPDITDTIKDLILGVKRVELGDTGDVTNFQLNTGSVKVRNHWEVWTQLLGSAFLFHTQDHDILESPTSLIGNMLAPSSLNISGGDY